MKLKAVVDSLDGIDEKYRDLYVAFTDGDKELFRLDLEGVSEHPDAKAVKNALDRQKQRVKELGVEKAALEARVEDLPEDFDLDLYQRAVTEGVGGGKIKNEDEVRREAAEAATARAEAKAKKDLDKANERADRLEARVKRDEKRKALDAALDEAEVTDPALRRGARALLSESIDVILDGEDWVAIAKDPDLGDIPVSEHVKTWAATDEGKVYVGARQSEGGGATGTHPGGNPAPTDTNPWKPATINVTEQARIRRENPNLANKLMREAGLIVR